MRLLISAGGTGGGVYPALAVAKWLQANAAPTLLWVGGAGGPEAEIVQRAGLPFKAIHGRGLHGAGWQAPLGAVLVWWGLLEALGLVRAFKPDVVLVTGGYITVPVALAAWLTGVPVLVYLPDIEPGWAVQFIARLARRIAVTVPAAQRYFDRRKVVVTGYPTRPDLTATPRAAAQQQFGLDPHCPTILATGGSRGAHSLNRAVLAALPDWLKDYQVIHLSGPLDWPEVERAQAALTAEQRARYWPLPFLHEMGAALAAADLVVSRAGASTLGEYPLFGLPAVLVPYPYAWRYQKVNADYLVARGAAVQLNDADLAAHLAGTVRGLLGDPDKLNRMRAASRAAATPDAAGQLAAELSALAGGARRVSNQP